MADIIRDEFKSAASAMLSATVAPFSQAVDVPRIVSNILSMAQRRVEDMSPMAGAVTSPTPTAPVAVGATARDQGNPAKEFDMSKIPEALEDQAQFFSGIFADFTDIIATQNEALDDIAKASGQSTEEQIKYGETLKKVRDGINQLTSGDSPATRQELTLMRATLAESEKLRQDLLEQLRAAPEGSSEQKLREILEQGSLADRLRQRANDPTLSEEQRGIADVLRPEFKESAQALVGSAVLGPQLFAMVDQFVDIDKVMEKGKTLGRRLIGIEEREKQKVEAGKSVLGAALSPEADDVVSGFAPTAVGISSAEEMADRAAFVQGGFPEALADTPERPDTIAKTPGDILRGAGNRFFRVTERGMTTPISRAAAETAREEGARTIEKAPEGGYRLVEEATAIAESFRQVGDIIKGATGRFYEMREGDRTVPISKAAAAEAERGGARILEKVGEGQYRTADGQMVGVAPVVEAIQHLEETLRGELQRQTDVVAEGIEAEEEARGMVADAVSAQSEAAGISPPPLPASVAYGSTGGEDDGGIIPDAIKEGGMSALMALPGAGMALGAGRRVLSKLPFASKLPFLGRFLGAAAPAATTALAAVPPPLPALAASTALGTTATTAATGGAAATGGLGALALPAAGIAGAGAVGVGVGMLMNKFLGTDRLAAKGFGSLFFDEGGKDERIAETRAQTARVRAQREAMQAESEPISRLVAPPDVVNPKQQIKEAFSEALKENGGLGNSGSVVSTQPTANPQPQNFFSFSQSSGREIPTDPWDMGIFLLGTGRA